MCCFYVFFLAKAPVTSLYCLAVAFFLTSQFEDVFFSKCSAIKDNARDSLYAGTKAIMCCNHINSTQILKVFNQDKVFSKNCMRPNAAGSSSGNVLILIQVWSSLCLHCKCLCMILLMRVNKGILLCNVPTAIALLFRGSFKRFHEIVSFRLGVEPINERLCVYCWLAVAESIFFKKLKKTKQEKLWRCSLCQC